ncbi:MAG: ROK family transcriptional regulator [Micromonosporaceae bacterium]
MSEPETGRGTGSESARGAAADGPHLAGSSRLLRAINETAALGHLLERGPLTRGDLRTLTGLAKPTTSEVLRRLQEAGLAKVVGRTSGGPGRNADVYAVNPDAAYAAAISVREHDHTLAVAICDLTGQRRAQIEVALGAHPNARPDAEPNARPGAHPMTDTQPGTHPVQAVADAVKAACEQARVPRRRLHHVQLAVPGSYDERTGVIRYVDVPGWSRPGLTDEIRAKLRTPVSVDNDVNLAATAERRHGTAAGHDSFALLWLGEEGLGLAIDLGGVLLRGARGGAGEIGYMPVGLPGHGGKPSAGGKPPGSKPPAGGEPPAGNLPQADGAPQGVHDFQDLVGGEAVRDLARQYGFLADTGQDATRAAVSALTSDDPAKAQAFLDALAVRIAVGLAAVVAVLDPSLVVLAGEVGQAGGEPLQQAVRAALEDMSVLETSVATTGVTQDAVLTGALDASLTEVRNALLGRRSDS